MPKKNVKKLLNGIICCVDTKNNDGSDASKETARVLESMGAQVESGGVRMGQTHMIWSNGNLKMVKAAEFMDIVVVSPLWVEQCRESAKLVPVDDFIVTPEGASKANVVKESSKVVPVPETHVADLFDDPDAFSSSQVIMNSKNKDEKKKKKSGIIRSAKSKKKTASTTDSVTEKENNDSQTPTFDENKKPRKSSPRSSSRSKVRKVAGETIAASTVQHDVAEQSSAGLKSSKRQVSTAETSKVSPSEVEPGNSFLAEKASVRKRKASQSKVDASFKGEDHPKKRKSNDKFVNPEQSRLPAWHGATKSQASPSTILDQQSSEIILSLSGFSGDDRCLLEDVVGSLISQHHDLSAATESSRGKGSMKKQFSSKEGYHDVDVILQGSDPIKELPKIKSMTSMTHVIAPGEGIHCNRTLRILFAMARQIPVLTPSWVYASLEGGGQWLLSPSEYERFLHPRFNPRTLSKKLSKPSTVYVGPCIDPSRRIVESLVQCCDLMTLTTSLKKAEWVVVGEPSDALDLLPSKSQHESEHIEHLMKANRILSCKDLFDAIELRKLPSPGHAETVLRKRESAPLKAQKAVSGKGKSNENKSNAAHSTTARVDDEDDSEFALVVPTRGRSASKKVSRLLQQPVESKRSSRHLETTKEVVAQKRSTKGKNQTNADEDGNDACVVSTPPKKSTKVSKDNKNKKHRAVLDDIADFDSDCGSDSGSDMSFQIETKAYSVTSKQHQTKGKGSCPPKIQDDDDHVEEDTQVSSYQSAGSPCW